MAKDVITRFKLETTGFDSKIKEAAKELSAYSKTATQAKEGFNQFTKANVDAARALGTMATSTTNAKDRAKELVGAFNEAAKAYNSLTKEQQQSDFGRAMAGSLQQLQVRIREAKQELYGLDSAMKKVSKGNNTMNQLLGGVAGKFGMSASMFTGVGAAVAGVGAAYKAISDNISTAMGFEKSMSQLSSLTGMVGKDLEQLKEYAIELGSTSTLTASQVADAFRLIGSQQPQLLSSGEALKEVTKYAITLSEAAGIDLVTAAQTLSTSINQMGGDSDNAARYVNVLAAASQKGAGDIAWLGDAITKSATAAKAVGTDYEELVANLEQLAKGGFDASTAGTALRSIIMNLEKQANQEFKPSIVGLTQAFENLGKANLDIVGYQEIAGKMFASQAKVLADAAGEARNMTTAITGTNTATEQATTNTTNLEGSLKALASAWEGLNLHLNSSNGYLKTIVDGLKDVVVWADKAISGLGEVNGNREKLNGEGNGGQTKVDRMVGNLKNTSIDRRQSVYTQQVSAYWKYINDWDKKLKEAESRKDVFAWETIKKNNDIAEAKANIAGAQSMLKEYQSKAQKYLKTSSPAPSKVGSNNGIVVDVDVDTEEGTKSIKELQNEIKKLKKLRDDAAGAGDTKLRDQYNAQIKSVQAEIKSMRGTGSTSTTHKTVQTELQQNQTKINTLTQEYVKLGDDSTEAARKRQAEIQKEIELLQQRNGLLNKRVEQAQGRLLSNDDIKRKAEIDIQVNTKQIEDLRRQLTEIEGVTIDPKTVTITATDEALPKLREIEGITIDDKTMTVTANTADALRVLQAVEGVTIEPKAIEVNANTSEAQKKIDELKAKIAELEDKNINIKAFVDNIDKPLGEGLNKTPGTLLKAPTTAVYEDGVMTEKAVPRGGLLLENKAMKAVAKNLNFGESKNEKDIASDVSSLVSGVNGVFSGIQSLGIKLPDEFEGLLRGIQGITSILTGISSLMTIIAAIQGVKATPVIGWALANGGVVPGFANGGFIDSGHSPSFLSFSKAAPAFATGGVVPQTFASIPKFATGGVIQKFNDGGTVEAGHAPDFLSFSKAMPKRFATGGVIQKFNDGGTVEAGHAPDFLSFSKAMPKFATGGVIQKFNDGGTVEARHAPDFLSFSKALPKFATGGPIPHANSGYFVGGTHFSGDVTPIMANAGELVLNKAQQGNLASQLQGGGMQGLNLYTEISMEKLRIGLNSNSKRRGKGEYVTSNRL